MCWTNQRVALATALYAPSKMPAGMSSVRTAVRPPDGLAPGLAPSMPNRRPSGSWRAAARSASLRAAQIHSTSACSARADRPGIRPETSPPPPRRADRLPSGAMANDNGPRLEATSSRPRAAGTGVGEASPEPACWLRLELSPISRQASGGSLRSGGQPPTRTTRPAGWCSMQLDRLEFRRGMYPSGTARLRERIDVPWSQLNIAHQEGWRDRPGEAPATVTMTYARANDARPCRERCQLRPEVKVTRER